MNKSIHKMCTHGGILFAVCMAFGFFFIPGWFPPVDPGLSADAVAAMYEERRMQIRLGMTLVAFGSVGWWMFAAAISMQMKRIEGEYPILSYIQMASASGTVLVVLFAAYFILAAAYRPDAPAHNVRSFHDIAWLMNIGAFAPGIIQNAVIGACILSDKSPNSVYPRWLGYINLWFAVLYLPGAALPFFHGGPFSWNGVIGFWLVAFCFFNWINLMWWYTIKAIKNT